MPCGPELYEGFLREHKHDQETTRKSVAPAAAYTSKDLVIEESELFVRQLTHLIRCPHHLMLPAIECRPSEGKGVRSETHSY